MLNYKSILRVVEDKFIVLKSPEVSNKHDVMSRNRDRQKRFAFDNVFGHDIPTKAVYQSMIIHSTSEWSDFEIYGISNRNCTSSGA